MPCPVKRDALSSKVERLASVPIFGQICPVTATFLPRKLWYRTLRDIVHVDDGFLQSDMRPLLVLGEAGMGKSTLLEQLVTAPGYAVCTARKLINSRDPAALLGNATTIVIDALDEVSVQRDGDAVDLVLRQLQRLGNPRFILSCRVADWRSATGNQGIRDFYEAEPLELHLEALSRPDAQAFLSETLGPERATLTLDHLEAHGLSGLWSNPQTLDLVEQVARAGDLPRSKGELFESAVRLLGIEHRETKAAGAFATLSEAAVLDAAGAAFASLILTGKDALSRLARPDDDDLPLRETATLPAADAVASTLDSRLFIARGVDRFTYAHRAIGEFLGARWLARTADTPRKRRRLLDLFSNQALVPASLRGLHAWLAWHSPELAPDVIGADPMGIIIYGDADRLSPAQGRALLVALQALSRNNPRFRDWTDYRVGGLIQPALLSEISQILADPDEEFGLRLLVLEGLKGSALSAPLEAVLLVLLLDPQAIFALRSQAGDRLAEIDGAQDWPHIIRTLRGQDNDDGIRLAIEMMNEVGFERFDDALVLDVALAQLERSERTVGVFLSLERKIPAERLDVILDGVSAAAANLGTRHERPHNSAITDLAFGLLARRLGKGDVDPERLWVWLAPFDGEIGYHRETRKAVADLLEADTDLRRAVQRLVLFDEQDENSLWQRSWRLAERTQGLRPTDDDVIDLLDRLEPGDVRWRELVTLVAHDGDRGLAVRTAALRLAAVERDGITWLGQIATPTVPEWQIEREARDRRQEAERAELWASHRQEYAGRIDAVRSGDYGAVVSPAKAYLNLFYDMGDATMDGAERIEQWLGPELCDASLAGFEAFLLAEPPLPTARQIAESHAEGRRWEAAYILVVALAERLKSGRGFGDLPDERLAAGFLELFQTKIDDHAGLAGLDEAIEAELRGRGIWEEALCLHFEPQFEQRGEMVDGLYRIMNEPRDTDLVDRLCAAWIERYPQMGHVPEAELIDRLLASPDGCKTLRRLAGPRRAENDGNDERRLNWEAVGIVLDFDEMSARLESDGPIDKRLFWHLRARQGDRRRRGEGRLDWRQLAWVIATFRASFPMAYRPEGGTSGDTNPWDASEYMAVLINRLGDAISDGAIAALAALRDASPDGYTELLRIASAEQQRKRVETDWIAPRFVTFASALEDRRPTTAAQLQAVLLEELHLVQDKLRSSDVDYYKGFFDGDAPRIEEECRDELLKMLRGMLPFGIEALPEGHLADDKRCDILSLLDGMVVPIEIKGQWHRDLWTAADRQLDLLYVNDWRAERGIYLVLWFGPASKKPPTAPPDGVALPRTAEALRQGLAERSVTTREGRCEVVVLDLTRPH
jgi:hypothetical protein